MFEVKKWKRKIYHAKRDERITPADAVYIGRPSPFGNPWSHLMAAAVVTPKVKDVAAAVEKFREYVKVNLAIKKMARRRLRGKDLICWCLKSPCHGEVLMDLANSGEEDKK